MHQNFNIIGFQENTVEDFIAIINDSFTEGAETFIATIADNSCYSITDDNEIVVTIFDTEILDIADFQMNEILLIPNPSSNNVAIHFSNKNTNVSNILMVDIFGNEVILKAFENLKDNNYSLSIDISSLSTGLYIISAIFEDGKILNKKLIVN